MLLASQARAARLEQIVKELQRHRFGRRAEKLPEDQLLLALEEVEQGVANGEAEADAADPSARPRRAAKRRANRDSLPAHLPRVEMVVDIEDHACPCCHNALHWIGEDVSELSRFPHRIAADEVFGTHKAPAIMSLANSFAFTMTSSSGTT